MQSKFNMTLNKSLLLYSESELFAWKSHNHQKSASLVFLKLHNSVLILILWTLAQDKSLEKSNLHLLELAETKI